MKSLKGIIFLTFALTLTTVLWYIATPIDPINFYEQLSYIVGGLALTGFSLVFLLSVRSKAIERLFNGLENVYFYHKLLSVFSIATTFLHGQLRDFAKESERDERDFREDFRDDGGREFESGFSGEGLHEFAGELGEIAQNSFLLLIVIAFFAKFLKYEHWRYIHRLMIIPFALGLFHSYFTGKYDLLQLTPLSIFTAITAIFGLGSSLYMLFFYQHTQFKHTGTVTNINKIASDVIELELTLNKKLNYKKGQFIFLKVFQDDLEKAPHPFSISGGHGEKIYITIKALGDFTKKLNESIQLNTKVALEGPYGHMDFEDGKDKQIWVAGGVGITPFLSYLKNNELQKHVELFYSYRGEEHAIYKQFLEEYANNHGLFKVNFIDTSFADRLHFDNYLVPENTSIFMCGPQKMMKYFNKQLKNNNHHLDITFEAFKFR